MFRSLICACLCLVASSSAALAVDPECQGASPFAMQACTDKLHAGADAKLNDIYKRLMPMLDYATQGKLVTAERAWIAYRDAQCDYEAARRNGTADPAIESRSCQTELTNERALMLRNQLLCAEGNQNCVNQ